MTDLTIPLTVLALELDASPAQLADRYADQILLDDLNRRCLDRDTARELIAEHQRAQAAAAAAQAEHKEAQRLQRERRTAAQRAEQAGRQALAERQQELLRDNPGVPALTLMRMASGDDGDLGRAGRRFDELHQAERLGHLGYMRRLIPTKEII